MDTNSRVRSTSITLPRDVEDNARHFILVMLERYNTRLSELNIQEALDWSHLLDLWRFGPGASNGIKGSHAAEKIHQSMTSTLLCEPLVRKLRKLNPYFSQFDAIKGMGVTVVKGSRLATVPKNEETERTIAIEPLGNMVLQLAAGRYLEGVLRYIGLNIADQQPKNKAMALRGSVDGSVATIDLSSASDMISIELVRRLLPKKWFDLLTTLRSPEIELPNGKSVELAMISTMGNGFTFPLMTLIISSLIYGMRAVKGGPTLYISWSHTCVFGDDIIVPSDEYEHLCELLTAAGLVVNKDKSFSVGPFRESCGGDYYNGYDVTPFYVKTLSDDPGVYVAMNQVFSWCAKHNCILPRTLLLLRSFLKRGLYLVPEWHNPDEGLLTSLVSGRYKHLQIQPVFRRVESSLFDMMLSVGGYVFHRGPGRHDRNDDALYFTPRLYKNVVRTRKARLPKGYLDGSWPLKRTKAETDYVKAYVFFLLGSFGEGSEGN